MPKNEPRHVCLAVEAFPFVCLVYLSIDYTCKSVRIYPINIVCNISLQNIILFIYLYYLVPNKSLFLGCIKNVLKQQPPLKRVFIEECLL